MSSKKKEEKDLYWYQDKLAQLDEECYVVKKEYESYLAKLHYPEFKDKIGRYYKSEHRYSSRSPFYEYHVRNTKGLFLVFCLMLSVFYLV